MSGGEILLIIVVALMLFGADKIPDIARTIGKGYAQLRNATNEIKNEINNSAKESTILKDIDNEVANAKNEIQKTIQPLQIENPIDELTEDIEDLTGPIKRIK